MKIPASGAGIQFEAEKMNSLMKLWKDQSGASAAEYALILAIVGSGIAGAAIVLGGAIAQEMNDAAGLVDNIP